MTYNSKRYIMSMVTGVLSLAAYIIYVLTSKAPAQEDIMGWARLMLAFIGIAVGLQVIVQIAYHVGYAIRVSLKEQDKDGEKTKKIINSAMVVDERDKLINLKSLRVGYTCAGIGLIVALFTLAGGVPYVIALHIIVGAGAAGALIEGCVAVFFHERGVRNG